MGVQDAKGFDGTQALGHMLGNGAADESCEPAGSSGHTRSDSPELSEPPQDDPAEQERREMMDMLCDGPEIVVADEGALEKLHLLTFYAGNARAVMR